MEIRRLLFMVLMVLSNWEKVWSTKQTYIVHVKKNHKVLSHAELCTSSLGSVSTSDQMLYLYTHAIPGYSATLTKQEARSLRAHPYILSVRPQTTYQLHTTRTPHFLGLDYHLPLPDHHQLPEAAAQQLVIIGVLDTGVWPESQSFDDSGYGPVSETRWNGTCEANVRCNNKLVGATSFSKAYQAELTLQLINRTMKLEDVSSPLDSKGHGTHAMSTAGGSAVPNASLFGYANGTARGMAPYARLAAYKVCWGLACRGADILAGMDQAINDGVDVLSLSIGSGLIGHEAPYYIDPIAQGAFAAMQKGIFVSCSAGNSGPTPSVMANAAPWIATVGAGTLDRDFPAYVVLGNGKRYHGVSLYNPGHQQQQFHPIVYAGLCLEGTLDPEKVFGNIVVCDRGGSISRAEKGAVVKRAGGRGMVLASTARNREWMVADAHLLPATAVNESAGNEIKKYISSARNNSATATITFDGTKVGPRVVWLPSPVVATFSSRGPNPETPHILKPDLIAPGLNILAAWPDTVGPSGSDTDDRVVQFNIVSGTSMSCPHVSGLAALLKAAHPDWSPAAIRSALMTTAYSTYFNNGGTIIDEATGEAATPFGYGAGHVDPVAALNPGLVYDLSAEDYVNFLCAINYTSKQIQLIDRNTARGSMECDKSKKYNANDLNYPSFAVPIITDHRKGTVYVNHTRTLTNVGQPGSTTYKVKIYSPTHSIKISITPSTLTFNTPNDKKSYTVTFAMPTNMPVNASQFGRVEWSDGKHTVGSPIAFSWTL